MDDDTFQIVARKLAVLRQELEALGLDCSISWRSPGGGHAPIAQLLAGDLAGINQVRKCQRSPAPSSALAPALASPATPPEHSCGA